MQAISNFINPYEVENKNMAHCLSSGAPGPNDIEQDLLQADQMGRKVYSKFVQERLVEGT